MSRVTYKYLEVTPETHRKMKAAAAAAGMPMRMFIEKSLNAILAAVKPETDSGAAKKID